MKSNSLHILVLGQSNVASHGESRGSSPFGRVFHAGKFFPLTDPIKGSSGNEGSVWSRFGPKCQAAGLAADLIISAKAVGATSMADWSKAGTCFASLQAALPAIQACPVPPTHVVFHQGERDNFLATRESNYIACFDQLYALVHQALPLIPWIFCRATFRAGIISETIRQAQARIIAKYPNIYPGPDTDLLDDDFRMDGTHFNQKGLDSFAEMLLQTFAALQAKTFQLEGLTQID